VELHLFSYMPPSPRNERIYVFLFVTLLTEEELPHVDIFEKHNSNYSKELESFKVKLKDKVLPRTGHEGPE
jgi:hypothetical protein